MLAISDRGAVASGEHVGTLGAELFKVASRQRPWCCGGYASAPSSKQPGAAAG